jgi:hypothetical protein
MLLFTGNGNSRLPVWVPPIQAYVDTEDVLKAMSKHIQVTGLIDNMFIEFENTKIPICSQHECILLRRWSQHTTMRALLQPCPLKRICMVKHTHQKTLL